MGLQSLRFEVWKDVFMKGGRIHGFRLEDVSSFGGRELRIRVPLWKRHLLFRGKADEESLEFG